MSRSTCSSWARGRRTVGGGHRCERRTVGPRPGEDRIPRGNDRLFGRHLLDPEQPLPAGRRRHRRCRGRQRLSGRAGGRQGSAQGARVLSDQRLQGDRLLRRYRRSVLAFPDGRRLSPGGPRREPGWPRAGAADVRRAPVGQGELRPRPPAGSRVRPVRRHDDGPPGRGEPAADDAPGIAQASPARPAAGRPLGEGPPALPARHPARHGKCVGGQPVPPAAGT